MNIVLTISPLGFSSRHHDMQYRWLISTRGNDVFQLISLWILTVLHLSTSMSSKACPEVSQSLVGFSHAASTVDCGDPNNATSEVIVQYTSTRVSSVILYQCRQSGFAPSSSSAVCMESGRWSPDPSQVVCRMVTTSMPLPTGRVLWFDSLKFLIEPSEWQSITCEINDHSEVASLLIHSSVMSWKLLLFVFQQIRTSLPLQ